MCVTVRKLAKAYFSNMMSACKQLFLHNLSWKPTHPAGLETSLQRALDLCAPSTNSCLSQSL